jgi:hypothetical protein
MAYVSSTLLWPQPSSQSLRLCALFGPAIVHLTFFTFLNLTSDADTVPTGLFSPDGPLDTVYMALDISLSESSAVQGEQSTARGGMRAQHIKMGILLHLLPRSGIAGGRRKHAVGEGA